MAIVLRRLGRSLCVRGGRWFLGLMLLVLVGVVYAAPSASYGKKAGADWEWVDPSQGNHGGYSMNYEATINVDGVYVGKSAYRRQRLLNTAKMTGVILTSAVASPLTGAALGIALEAGFSYIDGKLNRSTPPDPKNGTGTVCFDSNGFCATGWPTLSGVSYVGYIGSVHPGSYDFQPPNCKDSGCTRVNIRYRRTNGLIYDIDLMMTQPAPGTPVPVTSATDAAALSQLQPKLDGMNATVARNLADWARSKGIDVGTFTDYNGNVLAGPFDFPLPAKISSSIDPVTGIRYDTNVVQSVHVEANTDPVTSEADPLKLTQTETKKETETAPDGSKKEKTTTTTTTGGANRQQEEKPEEQVAPFQAPEGALYEKKTKTFEDVLAKFKNTVSAAPWMVAAKGFFTVNIAGGSCPQWSVGASEWLPAMDAGPYVCSQTMVTLYQLGGVIVLAVAAWAAFRIALL